MNRISRLIVGILLILSSTLIACGSENKEKSMYQMISMEEAAQVFETEGDYLILDVRHADEFTQGHIPGAINIDNDSIGTEEINALPDKSQTIYVYCRSGNRSKQAAQKLTELGYSNIIEFGGIQDWTGEIEQNEEEVLDEIIKD